MSIIKFKDGRTPVINSVDLPQGQVYTRLTLGDPHGSPSLGYTARVYNELGQEIGSALNQMDGRGWSVKVVGVDAVQEWYETQEQARIQEDLIFNEMEALLPQYTGWERYSSQGLLQSLVANVVTVNFQLANGAIRAYWHKEDRWETLTTNKGYSSIKE